jgi:HSP20 family molecular chaperone IbpA
MLVQLLRRFEIEDQLAVRSYPNWARLDYSLDNTNLKRWLGAKRTVQFTLEDVSWLIAARKYPGKSKSHHQHCSRGDRSRVFGGRSIACSMIFPAEFAVRHLAAHRSISSRSGEPKRFGAVPAVDVTQTDKGYEVTAELPGMEEKDIEVKLANGILTIKGEKRDEKEEKKKDYYVRERSFGSFERSFQVPADVDADEINASFKKGVLTVMLPKSAEAQRAEKKIEVKAG